MNRIYWDVDKISMLTDHLDASAHSHGMIQFFLCLEGELEIKVGKEKIKSSCVLVNKNVRHSFKANNKIHFTCVIEPVSDIGIGLNDILQDKEYCIIDDGKANELKKIAMAMRDTFDKETYTKLITRIYECFDITYLNKQFDDRILTLLDDMAQTMYESNGVGLAAPQVGILKRIAVIDVGDGLIELINPEIIKTSGSEVAQEGCLSVPGKSGTVERPTEVTVKATNRDGIEFEITGRDLLARAFCHEIDHLDGKVFVDKVIEYVEE